MRWERPAPELTGLVGDYFAFDSEGPEAMGAVEWILPGWPAIRFVFAERPITIEAREQRWSPLPEAGFYGTMSEAMRHTSYGGVTIGIGLTPVGVARLLDLDLSKYRDRIVPLDAVLPASRCAALVAELRASDQGPAIKDILDRFLIAGMGGRHKAEGDIVALNRALLDPEVKSAGDIVDGLDMPMHTLRRLALKRFGFPPKLLLMRTRFLRSLIAMKEAGPMQGYREIDAYYTDTSHFLRDSERFLGMTARRFLNLDTPFLDAVLRARKLVLGTVIPALGTPPQDFGERSPDRPTTPRPRATGPGESRRKSL